MSDEYSSQDLIQEVINNHPEVIGNSINLGKIEWISPLKKDGFQEYELDKLLDHLGNRSLIEKFKNFWPKPGAMWDALGVSRNGTVLNGTVLVEAKARLGESDQGMDARDSESIKTIYRSLDVTKRAIGVDIDTDWTSKYYQFANRIAHHCFLNSNSINSHLVYVLFVNHNGNYDPVGKEKWIEEFHKIRNELEIPNTFPYSDKVHYVILDSILQDDGFEITDIS